MERRVFIAIVLSFLVLYFYQTYMAPPPPSPKPAASSSAPAAPAAAPSNNIAPAAPSSAPQSSAVVSTRSPEPQAVVSDTAEHEISVETAKVTAVFTNRGGRLLHWRLKDYRDNRGEPVDLVPSGLPESEALPFTLRLADDPNLTSRLNDALYRVSDGGARIDATRSSASDSGSPLGT